VAKYLNITRGSATIALGKLKQKGHITEDANKFFRLNQSGMELVNGVFSKRHILIRFLTEVLHLSPETAEVDACKIEHLISRETGEKLLSFMGFFKSGRKEVIRFKESFKEFTYSCQSARDCQVCETECFYAGKN
jgi:Mn-dependent DtxR family transcriptional regulator